MFANRNFSLPRIGWVHVATDILVISLGLAMAISFRVGFEDSARYLAEASLVLPVLIGIRLVTFLSFKTYAVMWRYISIVDAVRLAQAVALSTIIVVAVTFFIPDHMPKLPRTAYVLEAIISLMMLLGVRIFRRILYESHSKTILKHGKRTLIYGAGQNGRLLVQRFKSDPYLATHVVGFIDDDSAKSSLVINGVRVLGDGESLSKIIANFNISQVIVAIPDVSGDFLRKLVAATRPFNLKPRLLARMDSSTRSNQRTIDMVRDINLEDLLNHPKREIDLKPLYELVRGRTVLVTGAGGSIGSELSRQLLSFEPQKLLLLDNSEFNLYEVDRELRLATHDTERIVPLLVDLKDRAAVERVIVFHRPELVFHAAAYKHVHLVETNPSESILNNVAGTKYLIEACENSAVERFVMISTDKAVNPAGTMGATKRVCELLVTAAALRSGRNYCSVRFGNVLGSSGSLIPLLKEQIRNGGPVTVTHPEMKRFFMLIPEAVSLVLKAATISEPGDINILKMGEPISIVEVARSLIAMMGRDESDIQIVYTGLRPGEKLIEELYLRGDEIATSHPDILTLRSGDIPQDQLTKEMKELPEATERLLSYANDGSKEALLTLSEIVKSTHIEPKGLQKDLGGISQFH